MEHLRIGEDQVHGLFGPAQEHTGQSRQRVFVHGNQATPDHRPGILIALQPHLQCSHCLCGHLRRAIPDTLALLALQRRPRLLPGQPELLGQRKPQRPRAVKARGKLQPDRIKTLLLARGAVQVEQGHPDFELLWRRVAGALRQHFQQAGLGPGAVAIGKTNGCFFQIRVVQKRQCRPGLEARRLYRLLRVGSRLQGLHCRH